MASIFIPAAGGRFTSTSRTCRFGLRAAALLLSFVALRLEAQTPTPFPAYTPSPTATPAIAPPNSNPYLDANFRGPRLVRPTSTARVLHLQSGQFLTFAAETLVDQEAGCVQRYHADGTLDPSFQLTALRSVWLIRESGGGKLLVAGYPHANSAAATGMQVLRVNSDGSTDPTFAQDALANGTIEGVTVAPDGRIVVTGNFTQFAGTSNRAIVRLLASGAVDESFSSPGFTGVSASSTVVVWAASVQPDGKVVIVGTFQRVTGIPRPGVARLLPDGTLDSAFVPSGWTNTSSSSRELHLLTNGQILVAGRFVVPASYAANPTGASYSALPILRLNADGVADDSFGCFEADEFGTGSGFQRTRTLHMLSDGKFLAAVVKSSGGWNHEGSTLYRFHPDGTLDPGFHRAAIRWFAPRTSKFLTGMPHSLAVGHSGNIVMGGSFNSIDHDGIARHRLAWLNADGTPLPSTPSMQGFYDYPGDAVRFSDGRSWITGAGFLDAPGVGTSTFPNNLVRVNASGTLDFSLDFAAAAGDLEFSYNGLAALSGERTFLWGFGGDGVQRYLRVFKDGTRDPDFAFIGVGRFAAAHALPDDRVVLSAGNDAQATMYASLTRIAISGAQDTNFRSAASGVAQQIVRSGGLPYEVHVGSYPIGIYPDGKTLVVFLSSDRQFHLVRLGLNGAADPAFHGTAFAPQDLSYSFPQLYDPVTNVTLQPANGVYTATNPLLSAHAFPDGSAVVVGRFTSFAGVPARGVVRIKENGGIDTSFTAGKGAQWATIQETETRIPAVEAIAAVGDGALLIAGDFEAFNGVPAPGIALLRPDGSVVANFSSPVHRIKERHAVARLFPQQDGSLLLSGPYSFSGENIERSLVRLNIGQQLSVTRAVSRKTHGSAGAFDVELPLAGRGVEPRAAAAGGNHTIVFTFNNDLAAAEASVTSGTGSVSSATVAANTLTVQLTGVADQQTITVALGDVTDIFGQALPPLQVQVGFLLGDTNGSGTVNASDIGETKANSGAAITTVNFRTDANGNGSINSTDTGIVKSRSGSTINAADETARAAR